MSHSEPHDPSFNYKIILTCALSVGIISLFYFLPHSEKNSSATDPNQFKAATDNIEASLMAFELDNTNRERRSASNSNLDEALNAFNFSALSDAGFDTNNQGSLAEDDRVIPAVSDTEVVYADATVTAEPAPALNATESAPKPEIEAETQTTPTVVSKPEANPNPAPTPAPSVAILKTKRKLETFSVDQINQLARRFYAGFSYEKSKFRVEKWEITFETRHLQNQRIEGKALVYLPVGNGPFPILGSAAGTTGIDDACAPSRENVRVANWGDYEGYHAAFAGQGYAVVFPDYSGFNDTSFIHHYFVSDLQAKVALDSLTALQNLAAQLNLPLQEKIYLSGYSQGAHTILAAADIWQNYAPNLPIAGIITYGAANDTVDLLKNNSHLGPYLVYAYEDLYGPENIDRNKLLQPRFAQNLDQDAKKCVGQVGSYYGYDGSKVYTPEFWSSLKGETVAVDFPRLHQALSQNISGFGNWNLPTLILQGATDKITPPETNKKLLAGLCADNKPTTYRELASTSHVYTRQRSFNDTLTWIEAVNSGENFPNTCNTL